MRDISTDDLIQTLVIKTAAAERARCVYSVHPTAANAKAVNARSREEKAARTALNTHLRECLRIIKATQHIKMPRNFIALSRSIPTRTANALKEAGIAHPEKHTVEQLLRIPGLGVQGLASIAMRTYANPVHPVSWPELNDDD